VNFATKRESQRKENHNEKATLCVVNFATKREPQRKKIFKRDFHFGKSRAKEKAAVWRQLFPYFESDTHAQDAGKGYV